MSDQPRCPFARSKRPATTGAPANGSSAPADAPAIATAEGVWRPQSSRGGIKPLKYVWWNMLYWLLETLNRGLARNPYRKVSWDKWPPMLGLLYLLAKIRFNRSNALTDPYDYQTRDTLPAAREPDAAKHYYTADGRWVSDNDDPEMGAVNTRFGSND